MFHRVLDEQVAHLSLYLLLFIEGPPELVVAALELPFLALLCLVLLLPLPLLTAQDGFYFLSDHHEGLKSALEAGGDLPKEQVGGKEIGLFGRLGLEHFLPGFVGSHKEA